MMTMRILVAQEIVLKGVCKIIYYLELCETISVI